MRIRPLVVACAATLSVLSTADSHALKALKYQVQVTRTSYGVPHIRAADWASMGYGYGYAFSQDNFCVLAREVQRDVIRGHALHVDFLAIDATTKLRTASTRWSIPARVSTPPGWPWTSRPATC